MVAALTLAILFFDGDEVVNVELHAVKIMMVSGFIYHLWCMQSLVNCDLINSPLGLSAFWILGDYFFSFSTLDLLIKVSAVFNCWRVHSWFGSLLVELIFHSFAGYFTEWLGHLHPIIMLPFLLLRPVFICLGGGAEEYVILGGDSRFTRSFLTLQWLD